MTTLYAVNTPFNWNATAGTKWSTVSGGGGGHAVPTASDDVIFDGNSGSGTVTLTAAASCRDLTMNGGWTGTLSFANSAGSLALYGNFTAGGTYSGTSAFWGFYGAAKTHNLNGKTITASQIQFNGGGATSLTCGGGGFACNLTLAGGAGSMVTLGDNFTSTEFLYLYSSGIDLNGHDLAAKAISSDGSAKTLTNWTNTNTITLTLANGGVGPVFEIASAATVVLTNTTIKLTGVGSIAFLGVDKTYGTLWCAGGLGQTVTINDSNTFSQLKADADTIVKFQAGETTTVTSLSITGTPGHLVSMKSSSAGTAWNLSSTGGIVVDYVSLQDSHAAGGGTFRASHSTDVSGNTGWTFSNVSGQMLAFF